MKILHITASARGVDSYSNRLADAILERLDRTPVKADVVLRDLGFLPHVDNAYANTLAGKPESTNEGNSLSLSNELICEIEEAEVIVIATPMHNFTVPSTLKAWIDHVVRIFRTFEPTTEGKRGLLKNKPVYIAIASGGIFLGEHARQHDFLTPYLTAALGTIGLSNVNFICLQGTVRDEAAVAEAWDEAMLAFETLLENNYEPAS